jgi:hypothetical protein
VSYESLESVAAFKELYATLGRQFEAVLADASTPEEASQAMVMLLRVLAMSTDVVADGDPRAPHFARSDTKARNVGGDNADAEYDVVKLDGRYRYRIKGQANTVSHLSMTFNAGTQGRRETFDYRNESSLGIDDAGNFTLLLSADEPSEPGTWIQTPTEPYSILVRQFIGSRETEKIATYDIELLEDSAVALEPHTDGEIAERIRSTASAFGLMTSLHRFVYPELFDTPHTFVRANSDELGADISGTDNLYMFATFDVEPDQALVIDLEPLEVSYWNISVMTRFHETIDHQSRPTSRTMAEVIPEPGGSIRLVLTHGKAVHRNWLDTAGHRYGILLFRWVGPRDAITELPTARVVALSELEGVLAQPAVVERSLN